MPPTKLNTEQLSDLFSSAAQLLADSIDVEQAVPTLGQLVVPAIADIVVITLTGGDGTSRQFLMGGGAGVAPGEAHVDLIEQHGGTTLRLSGDGGGASHQGAAAHRETTWSIQAAVHAPITAGGKAAGTLSLFRTGASAAGAEFDARIAHGIAALIGLHLRCEWAEGETLRLHEDRRRVEEELRVAVDGERERASRFDAELERRVQELQHSYERMGDVERTAVISTLSAGLGHDMGNLLLPLRLRLDSLNGMALPAEARGDLTAIAKVIEYLQRLSTGLRLLASDSALQGDGQTTTRLKSWFGGTEQLMRDALPPSVSFHAEIPTRLPAVRMAPSALTQAVFNLVQNAGDVLRGRSDGRVSVSAGVDQARGVVNVSVADNGPGLDDEGRHRCFEPFYSTKRRQISTGLGLAVVRALVRRAGGEASVDSPSSGGATFVLSLPIAAQRAETPVSSSRRAVVTIGDPRSRALVTTVLKHDGFDVIGADEASDAGVVAWVSDLGGEGGVDTLRRFVDGARDRVAAVLGGGKVDHPNILAVATATDAAGLRKAVQAAGAEHATAPAGDLYVAI